MTTARSIVVRPGYHAAQRAVKGRRRARPFPQQRERLLGRRAVVHDGHERARHGGAVGMLDHVAAVDDTACALGRDRVRAAQDLRLGGLAAAAREHGHVARDAHDAGEVGRVVGGIGLEQIGAQLRRLAHQRHGLLRIAIHVPHVLDAAKGTSAH
jgi:hypothetical protein